MARTTQPAPQAAAPQPNTQPANAAPAPQEPAKPAKLSPETSAEDALWEKAENEWGGYTLVSAENVKTNGAVEEVTPRIEREKDGVKYVVCKHIAK